MARPIQFKRWRIPALLGLMFLLGLVLLWPRSIEPVYQGRPLGKWLRGHPREYYPAVTAVGTNAVPYLLGELQARESGLSIWGKQLLAQISAGPFWRTAQDRRYHAGLALQILDSNAAPAMVNLIFSKPMRVTEGDPSYAGAWALNYLVSPIAKDYARERLRHELGSPDPAWRRNACLTLSLWPQSDEACWRLLVTAGHETNATVRVAAVRAIVYSRAATEQIVPILISRLEDEQAAVRQMAAEGLRAQGTNAVSAIPALRTAIAAEASRPGLREDLAEGCFPVGALSAPAVRWAMEWALKAIDPSAPSPANN